MAKPTPQIIDCRSCGSTNLSTVWNLSNSPYGDFYKPTEEEAINVKFETLSLGFCTDCKMLQLLEITDLTATYDDYLYRSSITNALSSDLNCSKVMKCVNLFDSVLKIAPHSVTVTL